MKLCNAILSVAAATLFCQMSAMAEDMPPAPPPEGPQHMHGPGKGRDFLMTPELHKLMADYKANPSDELKAQIKAKLAEAFDKFVKDEKARLDKLQANRDKEIDSRLEKILSGKSDDPKPPREKRKQQ